MSQLAYADHNAVFQLAKIAWCRGVHRHRLRRHGRGDLPIYPGEEQHHCRLIHYQEFDWTSPCHGAEVFRGKNLPRT
jgi:hypothetical protein